MSRIGVRLDYNKHAAFVQIAGAPYGLIGMDKPIVSYGM